MTTSLSGAVVEETFKESPPITVKLLAEVVRSAPVPAPITTDVVPTAVGPDVPP